MTKLSPEEWLKAAGYEFSTGESGFPVFARNQAQVKLVGRIEELEQDLEEARDAYEEMKSENEALIEALEWEYENNNLLRSRIRRLRRKLKAK